MKNDILIPIIVCILAIGSVFFLKEKKIRKITKESEAMKKSLKYMKNFCSEFTTTFNDFILYDNLNITNCEITDSEGTKRKLSDLITPEKLIIYLSKMSCTSCSSGEIDIINSIFSKEEKDNIVIIANFKSNRELKIFERNASIETFSVSTEEQFPSENLKDSIVFFLLSDSLNASCIFIPDRAYAKLSEIYYEAIANRLRRNPIIKVRSNRIST